MSAHTERPHSAVLLGYWTSLLIKVKLASGKGITRTLVCFRIVDRWNDRWSKK